MTDDAIQPGFSDFLFSGFLFVTGRIDLLDQNRNITGFGKTIECAQLKALNGALHGEMPREHDHLHKWKIRLYFPQDLDSVHARHFYIQAHRINAFVF